MYKHVTQVYVIAILHEGVSVLVVAVYKSITTVQTEYIKKHSIQGVDMNSPIRDSSYLNNFDFLSNLFFNYTMPRPNFY